MGYLKRGTEKSVSRCYIQISVWSQCRRSVLPLPSQGFAFGVFLKIRNLCGDTLDEKGLARVKGAALTQSKTVLGNKHFSESKRRDRPQVGYGESGQKKGVGEELKCSIYYSTPSGTNLCQIHQKTGNGIIIINLNV